MCLLHKNKKLFVGSNLYFKDFHFYIFFIKSIFAPLKKNQTF